jgi:multidrug efflux pump subunit AcrA (membrane-fusion protein)
MKSALALLFVVTSFPALAEDYACLIEPNQVLKLAAPVQGVVQSISVDRGDRVTKGQLVAQLDSEVEAANLQIAKLRATNDTEIASNQAKLDYLSRKVSRNEKPVGDGRSGV